MYEWEYIIFFFFFTIFRKVEKELKRRNMRNDASRTIKFLEGEVALRWPFSLGKELTVKAFYVILKKILEAFIIVNAFFLTRSLNKLFARCPLKK